MVAAHLASTGPLARCAAYAPSACLSRSRVSNKAIPSTARKVIQSRSARAYFAQVLGAAAPLTGSSRSHRFAATLGRGTPAFSKIRSSSTSCGTRSAMAGLAATSQSCQPVREKKVSCMSGDPTDATCGSASGKRPDHGTTREPLRHGS